jgi:hypothetical protein
MKASLWKFTAVLRAGDVFIRIPRDVITLEAK